MKTYRRWMVAVAASGLLALGSGAVLPNIATAQTSQGTTAAITVHVAEGYVTITSTKDLSNVVVSRSTGRTKYDGLSGKTFTVPADGADVVWVKSGNNKSGDGPGYGERFDLAGPTLEEASS